MKSLFTALLLGLLGSTLVTAAERPNVLFILADDLGWSDTTLYGQTSLYETPNLERLAAMGMTFTRAYTPNPLCSPTRSSILTGKHPARTGLTAPNCHTPPVILEAKADETAPPHQKLTRYTSVSRLDPKYETLGELFQADGYATAHFGKWHLGATPYSPLENGFDIDIPHFHGPGPAGSYVAPWKYKNGFVENYPGEHIEDRMADEIVSYLEEKRDAPFFINYWQFSVHGPFDAKADYIEKYRGKIDPNDGQRCPTYAAMVQSLDENVGKVLDALDRLDLTDNTIIVFTSDNGGNMYNEVDGTTPTDNRPLRGGKANNWDGGVRVPTIVAAPGLTEPGSTSDEFVVSQDFYPTLLALADIETPETELDGIDLRPTLEGKAQDRERIFTFFPHSTGVPDTLPPSASAYEGDWKLLRLLHDGPNGEHRDLLFNLADDIGERNDRAAADPDRAAAMGQALDAFLADTGAVYPKANPNYSPAAALLKQTGITPLLDATFTVDKDTGIATFTPVAANGKLNLTLRPHVEPGDLTFRIKFKSKAPGAIDLRWAEEGVKPAYFKDRLQRSKRYAADKWVVVEIPFTAKKAMTQMRVDFMQTATPVEIEEVQVLRGDKVVWESGF